MKMRTQILNFGLAGLALAALVAGVGFMTNRQSLWAYLRL